MKYKPVSYDQKYIIKDIKLNKIFKVKSQEESERFFEEYEEPNNLLVVEVMYSDGSGWNGNVSGYAYGPHDNIKIEWTKKAYTNNEAEYLGLLFAVRKAEDFGHICLDSSLVYNHVIGRWVCNLQRLAVMKVEIQEIIKKKNITLEWRRREYNIAGKAIEVAQHNGS